MPTWLWIHGIILVIYIIFWGLLYYLKLWRLSFPFNKMTSIKVILSLFLPFSWLLSSLVIGLFLLLSKQLSKLDKMLLIYFPLVSLLALFVNYYINSLKYNNSEKQIQKNINLLRDTCHNWVLQFPFLDENKYDLQVFISKNKPVGRMVLYELTCSEEKIINQHKDKLPQEVTLLISRK